MRIGILTSVETRHFYLVGALRSAFDVVAVGCEETGYSPAATRDLGLTPDEERIIADHFAERAELEQRYFGRPAMPVDTPACRVQRIAPGQLNTPATLALLQDAGVDTVVVYGTNLVRPPLLDAWPGRMLNLHLGLSPYYRGTATNFYPLLNDEPEYVGATIHLIDAGIDSGAICRHARPVIVAGDRPHTIGCKAIQAGVQAMQQVLTDLDAGRLKPVPQWPVENARLCLRRDYHPRQVVELAQLIEGGLIERYVERSAEVAPRVRLVE